MADPKEIERYKEMNRGKSREMLVRTLAAEYTAVDSAAHIAVKELIAEIDYQRTEEQRQATLDLAERHHSDRQRWTKVAAAVAVASAVAGWASFAASRFFPPPAVERRLTAIEHALGSAPPQPPTQTAATPTQTPSSTPVVSTPSPTAATTPAPKTTP